MKKLLERIKEIDEILVGDEIFEEIHIIKEENEKLICEINNGYKTNEERLKFLEKITGKEIDKSVVISLPFQTDFGKHITFGKNIFINKEAMFTDLGGITIEDNVLLGPRVSLITVNHIIDPIKRRGLTTGEIFIKRNAWIGAGVTILAGVTIGENSIVAANSTVTKDVPDNVIVAGTPAKIIKKLKI
ncbi:DapH/DapD/GlmU-related protein [Fusobacterium simiae]|uniref:DapH/DapD/GlmU-related protein n=1 Tax=Fusobacterium simiae TaxID=855 RepID=A0ABT4DJU0_FUSSI|nr:DapH/DapD/GlmU-related protein [Fusobacterium simiae]MCY7008864.1 DapH/DapD/GlmU-related protein [Fusobacterium simiae]